MNATIQAAQRAAAHKRGALDNLAASETWERARGRASDLWDARKGHQAAAKLRTEEREVTAGHAFDLFPTPPDLAARMVSMCDDPLFVGALWLEPSAGTGRIAQAIKDAGHSPNCIELQYRAYELLKARGFNVRQGDFLEQDPHDGTTEPGRVTLPLRADVIIMNPPFSKGQDIEHVLHAWKCLNVGGRIVAIMSEGVFYRQDKKAEAFRVFLDREGGYSEKLPPGTFKTSGTGANARLVILDK